jgi:hypothetical protein
MGEWSNFPVGSTAMIYCGCLAERIEPRWTAENRQFVDRAKPAISRAAETSEFYFVPSSVRKSVCTFVRQLRGPHFSTWA